MNFLGVLFVSKKSITGIVLLAFMLNILGYLPWSNFSLIPAQTAEAAQVTVEGSPNTTGSTHTVAGTNLVFVDDLIGYKFHRYGAAPFNGMCVYRKTTDGGVTWGSPVAVDTQTDCTSLAVWYDKWTPGDTGNNIHIATYDTGDDDMFYNRLNVSNDTLALATATSTMLTSQVTSYAAGTNNITITKATDGVIYMTVDDSNGTFIRSCPSVSLSCAVRINWNNVGTPPQGNNNSWSILVPLLSDDVMLINRSTGGIVRSSVWAGTSWTAFTNIDAAAGVNTTYDVGMAATIDTDTGNVYLLYAAQNNDFTTADHDIRSRLYSGGSWSSGADVLTDTVSRGILQVGIARDQNTGNLYAVYSIRTTIGTIGTGRVFHKSSTNNMTSWGTEQGPLNSTAGDLYGLSVNLMSHDRLYATWFNATAGILDVFGDTFADIEPEVRLTALGSQLAEVRSNVTDYYLGGSFAVKTLSARTLSTVIISETGTIQAQNNLKNIKLFYEFDTSAPYTCASESYSGSEAQFGTTVIGGFSGADGVAAFSPSPVSISGTQSICFYVVLDILNTAVDGDTIEISIAAPETDVLVSGGVLTYPETAVGLSGTTEIVESYIDQTSYHWRLDNGSQATASSATLGVENTPLAALQKGTPRRLRLAIENTGSTSTLPSVYELEYGSDAPLCSDVSTWTRVGDVASAWNYFDSTNLTHKSDTTNILVADGGVTNGVASFITDNNGVIEQTGGSDSLTIAPNNFTEYEFSLTASSSAVDGETYCFRLVRNDLSLSEYSEYPRVTISSDVVVSGVGSQIATTTTQALNVYSGGGFSIVENVSSRNVTSITLAELGTVNGAVGIANTRLYYEFDTSAPYNCQSVSYDGTETQFGTTSTSGFSGVGESITFNDSVAISVTSALCLYPVYDVTAEATDGQTIDIGIVSAASDIVVSSGSIGPSGQVSITGETEIRGPILTLTHYHWRNDNGNETAATSATGGTEDTPRTDFAQSSPIRLRLAIENTGTVDTAPIQMKLEYSPKITTCELASVWTEIDAATDGWDMYNSSFLTHGDNTTNISIASGGVSNGVGTFIASNAGVRDTVSRTASTTITAGNYLEVEFSITSTEFTSFDTTYCFRVAQITSPLSAYPVYAELTTAPKRDFKIQRGSVQVSGTSTILIAGTHYVAPASSTRAFFKITNSHYAGAGNTTATAGQNADDTTIYVLNPQNIATSLTLARPAAALSNTRVDWEIIEFIGRPDTDNEIAVRGVGTVNLSATAVVASGTVLSNVSSSSKVVVYITGVSNQNTSRNYYAGLVTASWDTATQRPVFRRGANGASIVNVSYAVVEYVGPNWNVQRIEHQFTAAGTVQTKPITAVNSLAKTFIHAQKRMGATTNVVHFGHEVWLSSIGALSFQLETGASVLIEQTSVAWVIENIQPNAGAMNVIRSNGLTTGGTGPLSLSVTIPGGIDALNNTSIEANTRAAGADTSYPRPIAGFTITSTTTYQIWRSNTGSALTYRVEIIEWPVADLSIRQNYYRFYVDNNQLTPSDPWPVGPSDIGENTVITTADEPLGIGERLRLRMTLKTANASMPPGFEQFKLQYALRSTTCTAIAGDSWLDVGSSSSGVVWRGVAATGTSDGTSLSNDPPTGGDLLISIADVSGSLVHQNPSLANPYAITEGEDVEYDWYLEQNGANPQSTYCFRVVRNDTTPLEGYNQYPQIRTAGFTPLTKNWRWYSDIENETPVSSLASVDTAPTNVANTNNLVLRINVQETKNAPGENIKFKLQFSEDSSFENPRDVVATSSCGDRSLWCYAEGGGVDNTYITNALLSGGSGCVASAGSGCGRHNTSPTSTTSHVHFNGVTQEYSFSIRNVAARVSAVYYFRLYDTTNDLPVGVAFASTPPSLVTEGPSLVFTVNGLPQGTTTAGVLTTTPTSASDISFGLLSLNTEYVAAHRISVTTNATEGYQVLKFARQQLMTSNGLTIPSIAATNTAPSSWSLSCVASSTGCVGYHSTDATLFGNSTRFAPIDSYAGLESQPVEVMYSSIPAADTHDIIYRILINELQPAGDYEGEITYLAVPSY